MKKNIIIAVLVIIVISLSVLLIKNNSHNKNNLESEISNYINWNNIKNESEKPQELNFEDKKPYTETLY